MKTIILTPEELASGMIIRPLIKQLPDEIYGNCSIRAGDKFVQFGSKDTELRFGNGHMWWFDTSIPLQYPVGTVLGVKETWDYSELQLIGGGTEKVGYLYKADGYLPCTKWKSPSTMPSKAIRTHVTVLSDEVMRVQELPPSITSYLIDNYKYMSDTPEDAFKQWWNEKYAKPRKQGDGTYASYPWDLESWLCDYKHHIMDKNGCIGRLLYGRYADGDEINMTLWKGKPLTIYSNPFIEKFKVEVK